MQVAHDETPLPQAGFRVSGAVDGSGNLHDASHFGAGMGRELLCTVRSGGKTASGKALLETNEIVFRGDLRLKIPFASLKSAVARDGELHLKWGNESAVFNLGEQAEKWAYKILHPKSTADKLGIKPGLTISAIALSDDDVVRSLSSQAKSFSDARAL